MTKPHKHAELIKAWADGAEIEVLDDMNRWQVVSKYPYFEEEFEYRIKPAKKVVRWLWIDLDERKLLSCYATEFEASHTRNLIKAEWTRMEFDE